MTTRIFSLLLLSTAALGLSACSSTRETLGLTNKKAPDEFKVVKNAPLEIPPSLQLPTPRPGAPRPQEVEVAVQAKAALLGTDGVASSNQITASEVALLQQAGATKTQSNIRTLIDGERGAGDESSQSVAKRLLGIGGDNEPDDSVLNAEEETERLKKIINE